MTGEVTPEWLAMFGYIDGPTYLKLTAHYSGWRRKRHIVTPEQLADCLDNPPTPASGSSSARGRPFFHKPVR